MRRGASHLCSVCMCMCVYVCMCTCVCVCLCECSCIVLVAIDHMGIGLSTGVEGSSCCLVLVVCGDLLWREDSLQTPMEAQLLQVRGYLLDAGASGSGCLGWGLVILVKWSL